jgi:hypothetical protein
VNADDVFERHVIVCAGSSEWPAAHAYVIAQALDEALGRCGGEGELHLCDDALGVARWARTWWIDAYGWRRTSVAEDSIVALSADGLAGATGHAVIRNALARAGADGTVDVLLCPWGRSAGVRGLGRWAESAGVPVRVLEGTELLGSRPPSARGGRWPR